MIGSGTNLATTVLGFGMSSTFIVFVCVRLICSRSRSDGSPPSENFNAEPRSNANLYEHSIHGLEPVVVAAIPTLKYSKESFILGEDAQCTICLGEYQDGDLLGIMPNCGHNFHLDCIDIWLKKQPTCPICRLSF